MNSYSVYRLIYLHQRLAQIHFNSLLNDMNKIHNVVTWTIPRIIGPIYIPLWIYHNETHLTVNPSNRV